MQQQLLDTATQILRNRDMWFFVLVLLVLVGSYVLLSGYLAQQIDAQTTLLNEVVGIREQNVKTDAEMAAYLKADQQTDSLLVEVLNKRLEEILTELRRQK